MDLGCRRSPTTRAKGFKLLEEIHGLAPDTKVIVLTGQNDRVNALKAIGLGAHDFCTKPFEPELLTWTIDRAFRVHELQEENRRLQLATQSPAMTGIITRDPEMQRLCRTIEKVAPTSATVLILGDSGTGKELFAPVRSTTSPPAAATVSSRSTARPFPRRCSRASSSATKRARSPARASNRSARSRPRTAARCSSTRSATAVSLQAKLLRFLQERVIERVGGRQEIPVDVRIVCATHQSLKDTIARAVPRGPLLPPRRDRRRGPAASRAQGGRRAARAQLRRRFAAEQRRGTMTLLPDAIDAIEAHPGRATCASSRT
jgi:two-component system NtrC family response regulator